MLPIDTASIDHTQKENNISELQSMLRGISYSDSTLPRPAVTGIHDDVTDQAIRAFQKHAGLDVTGNADPATWQALRSAHGKAAHRYAPAAPLYPVPGEMFFTMPLPKHFIMLLQLLLNTLSEQTGILPPTPMTGRLDTATAQALSAMQSLAGLVPTGRPDAAAWDAVAALYNLEARKFFASPPIKPPKK